MMSGRTWVGLFIVICGATFTMRLLLDSSLARTPVVYLLFPFALSIVIYAIPHRAQAQTATSLFSRHLKYATIIMLASSALLFEGFLCVLFFMPIYYLAVTVGYLYRLGLEKKGKWPPQAAAVHLIPMVVLALSMEGTFAWSSLPRQGAVTEVKVVEQSVEALKANMAKEIRFEGDRSWFLSLFPLPHRVEAGSLEPGDVHRVHFTYRRWFFANTHEGRLDLLIETVEENRIRTRVIRNDSYLANYMQIEGTDVVLRPLASGETEIELTLHYRRLLDPAWYFAPLQEQAMRESASYLIDKVIARSPGHV